MFGFYISRSGSGTPMEIIDFSLKSSPVLSEYWNGGISQERYLLGIQMTDVGLSYFTGTFK